MLEYEKFKKKYKIFLKLITTNHITKSYVKWMNDYEVVKYTEQRFKRHTITDIKKFVKEKMYSQTDFLYGIFICDKKKIHVGNLKIGPINKIHKTAEISYFVGEKKYWKIGIASKALKKGIEICKKKYKLKKLIAGCYSTNKGSIRVLKKNKFKKEAVLKSQVFFENKRIDLIMFGLVI